MDKFEQRVQEARDEYQPSEGFVDRTMEEVRKHKIQRRRFGLKMWAPAAVGAVAVFAIAIVLVPKLTTPNAIDNSKNSSLLHKASVKSMPSSTQTAISDGNDDASLQRDLNSVQASMTQTDNDQSSADSAVNNSQQEINVTAN